MNNTKKILRQTNKQNRHKTSGMNSNETEIEKGVSDGKRKERKQNQTQKWIQLSLNYIIPFYVISGRPNVSQSYFLRTLSFRLFKFISFVLQIDFEFIDSTMEKNVIENENRQPDTKNAKQNNECMDAKQSNDSRQCHSDDFISFVTILLFFRKRLSFNIHKQEQKSELCE